MTVKRAGKEMILDIKVDSYDDVDYLMTDLPQITAEPSRVREAWLKK